MITNFKKHHRCIATFFLLIFFPTILPNNLFASNNGPNSFEAGSFEPVDAADMVNLVTGDLSYVLPLLNVPSPEGGYSLALSNHSGVAMRQEASWVGLGWSLNPGAINRNINGYPDDISLGKDDTFVYDKGGKLDFYNLSLGLGVSNGITAGVGAYWGSNRTFGGSVSLGLGNTSVSVGTGTLGLTVGLGYSGNLDQIQKISLGFSLKSIKNNGGNVSSIGAGITSDSQSYSQNDYDLETSTNGFGVSAYGFYLYYGHKRIKYSLFDEQSKTFSGILYPNTAKNQNHDTNKLVIFDDGSTNMIDINDLEKNYLCDNVLLPNYDKYQIHAQGLSGSITPVFIEETKLKHQEISSEVIKTYTEGPNTYSLNVPSITYGNQYITDQSIKLNDKVFFEFENQNSSFLRIDRTNLTRDLAQESSNPKNYPPAGDNAFLAQMYTKTAKTNSFNEEFTNDNYPLKKNNRKVVGKYVEVFTNKEILEGVSNTGKTFINPKNFDRNQSETYRPESIGGYQITDTDGKVYHYSLPVINFEISHKNYSNLSDENALFVEQEQNVPYATDWLLTAVTGPDFIDKNNNNMVDSEDYGYWVEFEYGKWSDGFLWGGDSNNYDVIKGNVRNENQYEYYRGRKQIYYLDAVRTRTHTAYFVKSLRKDAQANSLKVYNSQVLNVATFNKSSSPKIIASNRLEYVSPIELEKYNLPKKYGAYNIGAYYGYKKDIKYYDFPVHSSLKLDKIILVKNNTLNINKSSGYPLISDKKAYLYKNKAFEISNICYIRNGPQCFFTTNLNGDYNQNSNYSLKEIPIHQSENVIDINDLGGLNVNSYALKVINFEYDENYSLVPNSVHSSAFNKGKLTLNAVDFLGKGGVKTMPKYQFTYNMPETAYNINNEDGWGYHKSNPTAWSLSQIISPIGSKISIQYESDDYAKVASKASRVFNKGMSYFITKNTATNELFFEVTKNSDVGDNEVDEFSSFTDFFRPNESIWLDLFICRRSKYGGDRREVKLDLNEVTAQVVSVNSNSVIFKLSNSTSYWNTNSQNDSWILNRKFSLTSVKHSDGSNDGVIMRNAGNRNCWEWRDSYDNDDVNFHYRLASSRVPNRGKGGGVRVKEINVSDANNVVNRFNYFYNTKGYNKYSDDINYLSSGVTSYVPSKEFTIMPYASELPSPIVMYSNVSVENKEKNNVMISKTDYVFETLNDYQNEPETVFSLGNFFSVEKKQNDISSFSWSNSTNSGTTLLKYSKYLIKTKLSNLGRLISISNYNSSNQLLNSLKNDYYLPQDIQDEFGTKQESFLNYFVKNSNYEVNAVSKIFYPSKLLSTSISDKDYKKKNSYIKYDFLTGEVLETSTVSSNGQSLKTKIVPAYIKYPEMGSKVDNLNNKNMLSQAAANYSYILDKASNDWKETGVDITTWSNIWSYKDITGATVSILGTAPAKDKIWRKHKTYVWNGVKDANGIFINYDKINGSKDDNFNWAIGVGQPSQWKQTSEVTLYNHYSTPLEIKDINGNYAATKMGDNNTKIMVTGNAGYNEMFYCGAENTTDVLGVNWLEPDIKMTNATRTNRYVHSGKLSVEATSSSEFGVLMKSNEHRTGKYKVSVWVHKSSAPGAALYVNVNGSNNVIPFTESYTAGNWVLKSAIVNFNKESSYTINVKSINSTAVYLDDLMIRPVSSTISGYVYNEWDELTHIIGNNGLATRFEYDAAGRLIRTYVEVLDDADNGISGGFKLKSVNKINYKGLTQ